jgi:FKBP-type peptidyl-prolyl cis-trans isomerase
MKTILFFVFLFNFCIEAKIPSFTIEKSREYELLYAFLRSSFVEEDYGYVLEGIKPISIRNYYRLAHVPLCSDIFYCENEIKKSLVLYELIPLLKKMNQYQKKFILKVTPLSVLGCKNIGMEVQFIHIPLLQKTIEENITLFKYILGPVVEAKELVNRIAYSDESLSDILLENQVLIGIVLGFGTHNSLVGGRQEQINSLFFSQDMLPFASKGSSVSENYAYNYFNMNGGNDTLIGFRSDFIPLVPTSSFQTIKEEQETISSLEDSLPDCLNQKPRFCCNAYKGSYANEKLFDNLIKSQKNIHKLLSKDNFLEIVLKKILGISPLIHCKKKKSEFLDFSFFRGSIGIDGWNQLLFDVTKKYNEMQKKHFYESFFHFSNEPPSDCHLGASIEALHGLELALDNLSESKEYFKKLTSHSSLSTIVDLQLYYKIIVEGTGKNIEEYDRVKISYDIKELDESNTIINANHKVWLSRAQMIPGLAHGMKEMKIGEEREIYIYPSLAYGVLTTLSPCKGLIARVQLHDIDEKSSKPLPALIPINCDWIEDSKIQEKMKETCEKAPLYTGWFYRNLMNKIETI